MAATEKQQNSTVFPDKSTSFYSVDKCTCSFDGLSGGVVILAVGTTTAQGLTTGMFQIVSASGGLDTLAGYGSFSSFGQADHDVHIVEHLEIT
ncbi:MAG: DUF3224 domain-containing protein [Rhodomicrobium sp.]